MTHTYSGVHEIAVRCIRMMGDGTREEFDELVHPDAVNREAKAEPPAARGRGPAAVWASAQWLRGAFADLHWEIHDIVGTGDLVAVHTTMSGRQIGPFIVYDDNARPVQAFPSTGKTFAVTQSHWCRIVDGQLFEHWANRDDLGQATQLGWVPPTPLYIARMQAALRRARRESAS
ncbi:ester cyclase [Nocardia sp. CDC160]|uniref:ester cyclase n=1 Tax=Nocardia sp. CDC160 TaxID=3112166 RepID=UPI002DBED519|nr:ester cyclase [Nocardia sp. CDC160]MEC3914966.1 ester cyclase [Nocardia sp. CDC160]